MNITTEFAFLPKNTEVFIENGNAINILFKKNTEEVCIYLNKIEAEHLSNLLTENIKLIS